jgi:hypothetical protein
LRPDRPLLAQRKYWFPNGAYNKPSIATMPLSWQPGFHSRADNHFNFDPDLRLIHLHRLDYDLCLARHRKWRTRDWASRDLEAGWAGHNRITDDGEFERWFYEDSAVPGVQVQLEEIPSAWKQVL